MELYLDAPQGFVAREQSTLANGKVARGETTGVWHQIRSGYFLQLTNNAGFYRLLNVGGTGDLYLGLQLPDGGQTPVVLRQNNDAPPEHTVEGVLRATDNGLFLDDVASDLGRVVCPGETVAAFLREQAAGETSVPVRAAVRPEKDGDGLFALHVMDIQRIPPRKHMSRDTPDFFLDAVAEARWGITRIAGKAPDRVRLVTFLPREGNKGGKLDLFDGLRHATGKYTLLGGRLSLSGSTQDAVFIRLFRQTRSWRLIGEVLELLGDGRVLAQLEKTQ